MYYRYMTVYRKKDESLVYKATKCRPGYRVGDRTPYGWIVVEIQRIHNGHIYSTDDYTEKLTRKKKIRDFLKFIAFIDYKKVLEFLFLYIFIRTQIKI